MTTVSTRTFWRMVGMQQAFGDEEAARLLGVTKQQMIASVYAGVEADVAARIEQRIEDRYRGRGT